MKKNNMVTIYQISEDIVAREIEGELIIVPLVSGIGDLEDVLFTLNETGKAIWNKIDGKANLETIAIEMANEFNGDLDEIKNDVYGLLTELANRRMLVPVD